jgi:hypothetical protein
MTLRHSSQAEIAEEAEESKQALISRDESEEAQEPKKAQAGKALCFHRFGQVSLLVFAIESPDLSG